MREKGQLSLILCIIGNLEIIQNSPGERLLWQLKGALFWKVIRIPCCVVNLTVLCVNISKALQGCKLRLLKTDNIDFMGAEYLNILVHFWGE